MNSSAMWLLLVLGIALVAEPIRACVGGEGEGADGESGEGDGESSDDESAGEECDCELPDEEVNETCKSKLLKGIMEEAYAANQGDFAAIQDAIQANAVALFGGEFEVACTKAPGDIGYRNWYSKGKMCKWPGDEVTCVAWRD